MSLPAFGTSLDHLPRVKQHPFEADRLPLQQKEELCRNLLAEFGATHIRERRKDHELIHGCLIDPSHTRQDREPTASLNYERLVYRCLGCDAKGGLLWFIAQCRGEEDIAEARRWLAKATGLDGQVMDLSALMQYFDALYAPGRPAPPMPTYGARMLEPWASIHPYLTDPKTEYGRGIPEENVVAMQVGYAPDYRIGSDRTSERIVLPHFWRGDLVGWQTRRLLQDGTPKYLSSPDFPKDLTLYHYDPSRPRAVVVEGMLSVVSHLHAVPDAVATFGATVTSTQASLLAKHERVVLCMDNDEAGWRAVEGHDIVTARGRLVKHEAGLGEVLGRSTTVFVWENPYAADPADLDTEDYLDLIERAVPFSVWRRPTRLLCYRCREVAHDGSCALPSRP